MALFFNRRGKKKKKKRAKFLEARLTGKMLSDGGKQFEVALIPADDAKDYRGGAENIRLRDRIFAKIRPLYKDESSDADDETSTDVANYGAAMYGGSVVAELYYEMMRAEEKRRALIDDYMVMDRECVYSRVALNVTVANVFTSSEGDEESWKITSDDAKAQNLIEEFDTRLDMHQWMPKYCRGTLRAGDSFVEPVVDQGQQVSRLKWLPPKYMVRHEDQYGRIDAEQAFTMEDSEGTVYGTWQYWQCVHVRYDHDLGEKYGNSFYSLQRRPWRQYGLMDDGVVISRVSRSGKRYIHFVPMSKSTPFERQKQIIEEVKQDLKRSRLVDSSGNVDLRKRVPIEDNDMFLPIWEGSKADVKLLDQGGKQDNYDDLTMKRNEIIIAGRVPKAYMGLDDEVRGRAHLGWQDIEFARGLRAIQKLMAGGCQRRLYNLELFLHGVVPRPDLYKIIYPPISFVDEKMKLEVLQLKWQIATMARLEMGMPTRWVLTNIIGVGEEEIDDIFADPDFVSVQPGQPGGGGEFGQKEQRITKEAAFGQMRIMDELTDLRDRLRTVGREGLNRSVMINARGDSKVVR